MYYKISNGSITLSGNTILENIDFKVSDNEKIGIVGRNGSGKTTLLKAIVGEITLENGYDDLKVERIGEYKIGYVKQNIDNNLNMKMIDYILDAYKDIITIENDMSALEKNMIKKYDEKVINKYNDLMIKYEYIGGYTYKKEYEIALKKFGFNDEDKNKLLSEFSGGQLTKLSLIKLLLSKPDLLILDEPTNHLDIINKNTIEKMLKKYKGTIIMVSHDRYLIKNVCNKLLVFNKDNVELYNYGYDEYIEKRNKLKDNVELKKEIKVYKKVGDVNLNKEINRLEKMINNKEKEVIKLNQELLKEEVYMDINKSKGIQNKIDALNEEIELKTNEWEELISK